MNTDYSHSLFIAWMNRPLARVHVTTFQYALKVFKDALSMRFHCLPPYRGEPANSQRKAIAERLKEIRHVNGRSKLWHYDMESGNYADFNGTTSQNIVTKNYTL